MQFSRKIQSQPWGTRWRRPLRWSAFIGLGIAASVAMANQWDFDGKVVKPDCGAMRAWYDCRSVRDASADVKRGYDYFHHTSSTLGVDGSKKHADGAPYANSTNACSSCHFSGGQVPLGTPLYQSPDKYATLPYFRPLNYKRDLKDSIRDCFANCMNTMRPPAKDDPVMNDLVAYIEWVADGVTDPSMRGAGWPTVPGHELPKVADNATTMRANPVAGARLFQAECASCHSKDGPGQGEYRRGEPRPKVPPLWGRHSSTRGAAFFNTLNLAGYVRTHMPFGKPGTLAAQQALDVAAFINDQPRELGLSPGMFCHTDADGIPATLRKPVAWNVGCAYPGEPFTSDQLTYGPWAPIAAWREGEIARLKAQR